MIGSGTLGMRDLPSVGPPGAGGVGADLHLLFGLVLDGGRLEHPVKLIQIFSTVGTMF